MPARIDQSVIGPAGNCQSACLAMLLGLPLSEVPNFLELLGAGQDDEVSFRAQQVWLNERGWGLVTIQARGPFFKRHFAKGYVLVGGKSSRGLPHAVIYKDGELWHDPHPDRGGVVEIEEVDILYPLAPFQHRSESDAMRHDLERSVANHVADLNDKSETKAIPRLTDGDECVRRGPEKAEETSVTPEFAAEAIAELETAKRAAMHGEQVERVTCTTDNRGAKS